MAAIVKDWKGKREELKVQRAPLAAKFDRNPGDLLLALKLMAIDDEIAKCTEFMTRDRHMNPVGG